MLIKLDEENENCRPLFVIVNAGVNFNMMEEVNRVVINSLDRCLELLHSVNKVIWNIIINILFYFNLLEKIDNYSYEPGISYDSNLSYPG